MCHLPNNHVWLQLLLFHFAFRAQSWFDQIYFFYVTVGAVLDRYENRAQIQGAVYRDGMYQINGEVNTVKKLIDKAEGLRGDAFLTRAQLQRENPDLTLEMIPVDLQGILNGTALDVELQRNDVLFIPSIHRTSGV